MTCPCTCPIYVTYQRKFNPPTGCTHAHAAPQNGYRAMSFQEQRLRMDAINYKGDWDS